MQDAPSAKTVLDTNRLATCVGIPTARSGAAARHVRGLRRECARARRNWRGTRRTRAQWRCRPYLVTSEARAAFNRSDSMGNAVAGAWRTPTAGASGAAVQAWLSSAAVRNAHLQTRMHVLYAPRASGQEGFDLPRDFFVQASVRITPGLMPKVELPGLGAVVAIRSAGVQVVSRVFCHDTRRGRSELTLCELGLVLLPADLGRGAAVQLCRLTPWDATS